MRRGGLTLIETLAVVVLLGITAATTLTHLSGATDSARLREAGAIVRDADARARLLAQSEGPLFLELDADRGAVSVRDPGGRVLLARELPARVRVEAVDENSQPIEQIVIDARGRSGDYTIVATLGDRRDAWRVAGLTGWIEEVR